ncbi:MAG TPA: HEAT repeat domain-containing protein [Anaerolineales bacterium]|nr:HEAT repeat domain-containing protein [Anaerolineales bacterium]
MNVNELITLLKDSSGDLPDRLGYFLTSYNRAELADFCGHWQEIPLTKREEIIGLLEQHSSSYLTDEIALALFQAETDSNIKIRCMDLMDMTDSLDSTRMVIKAALEDADKNIRLKAIGLLSECAYDIELEEIDSELAADVMKALLSLRKDPDEEIQQSALYSASFVYSDEVEQWIKEAFNKKGNTWQETAMYAVGRNLNPDWESRVMDGLYSKHGGIRRAAILSAGDMSLENSRDRLIELLDEEIGSDLFEDVIIALGKVGGDNIRELLESIGENSDDEDVKDAVEEALMDLELRDPESFMDALEDDFGFDEEEDEDGEAFGHHHHH